MNYETEQDHFNYDDDYEEQEYYEVDEYYDDDVYLESSWDFSYTNAIYRAKNGHIALVHTVLTKSVYQDWGEADVEVYIYKISQVNDYYRKLCIEIGRTMQNDSYQEI